MRVRRYACLVRLVLTTSAASCGGDAAELRGDGTTASGGLVGNPAPDFSVATVVNGKGNVALRDLRGKVVLVDFWGTFCDPCKKSFPKLQDLYARYASRGLSIVGISEDEAEDKEKIPSFGNTYGAKFTLAWDRAKSAARSYKPETMPSSFLVDKEGVIRYAHVGYRDGEEVEVEKEIKELLAQ
jgi:cytochrome c biogenesis protein CcmG/thiol:disulfide interchange protein DsbE